MGKKNGDFDGPHNLAKRGHKRAKSGKIGNIVNFAGRRVQNLVGKIFFFILPFLSVMSI